jgi:hypothetical protein
MMSSRLAPTIHLPGRNQGFTGCLRFRRPGGAGSPRAFRHRSSRPDGRAMRTKSRSRQEGGTPAIPGTGRSHCPNGIVVCDVREARAGGPLKDGKSPRTWKGNGFKASVLRRGPERFTSTASSMPWRGTNVSSIEVLRRIEHVVIASCNNGTGITRT